MRLQGTFLFLLVASILSTQNAVAQSKQYKRPKAAAPAVTPAAGPEAAPADNKAAPSTATGTKPDSEKLDITELEQKYWAPKDTDFSVVQNRTYTKAEKVSVSLLAGQIVNDPYNSGLNYSLSANYYYSERYGIEFMFLQSDLEDSKAVDRFMNLPGGGTRPNYNRPMNYYGVGFNWVPFYAKMSFLGKRIIYFDMQITPHIGMSQYDQIVEPGSTQEKPSTFAYGFDVTQYFFFSKHVAVRANLHNRWYSEDVRDYSTGVSTGKSGVNVTNFLMGVTYFF